MWLLRELDSSAERPLAFRLTPGSVKTMGRAPGAEFCVDAPLVSRLHCRLTVSEDGAAVEVLDLGSTNGTWIDGETITRATLAEGHLLRVGRVEFVLERSA